MHYGLLPRANRGIFAINELPDLAGKIQVALFNIMQEGDVQIKGLPRPPGARRRHRLLRQPRGLHRARQDRHSAQGPHRLRDPHPLPRVDRRRHRHHRAGGLDLTSRKRTTRRIEIPQYVRQIVEQIAFSAREDKKVDKRSGVSQRLPITTMELVVSNAERRALLHGEDAHRARVGDIYAALPGITGKIELEYEGEMRGADTVVREIIRTAVAQHLRHLLRRHQHPADRAVVQPRRHRPAQRQAALRRLTHRAAADPGPHGKTFAAYRSTPSKPEVAVSAAEFLLEGMTAHKKISRSEARTFSAGEKRKRNEDAAQLAERMRDRLQERDIDDIARNRTSAGASTSVCFRTFFYALSSR
jgi:magnesium chelatase subunit I